MFLFSLKKKKKVPSGAFGNVVIKLPLPPGTLPTLWQNDKRFDISWQKKIFFNWLFELNLIVLFHRYVDSYLTRFKGYFDTGDAGYQDNEGYVFVMSRTDDLINVFLSSLLYFYFFF